MRNNTDGNLAALAIYEREQDKLDEWDSRVESFLEKARAELIDDGENPTDDEIKEHAQTLAENAAEADAENEAEYKYERMRDRMREDQ